MKPPRGALVVVGVVAVVYAATLLVTDPGVGAEAGWVGGLVTERDLGPDDVGSRSCAGSPDVEIAPGSSCALGVPKRFRTVRRVRLRLVSGGSLRVDVDPYDDRELTTTGTVGAGATTDLTVSSGGADLTLTCDGGEPCAVSFG